MNIYQEHGCSDRLEYLENLADNYSLDIECVLTMADLLGPSEDFDGLVSALEDVNYIL